MELKKRIVDMLFLALVIGLGLLSYNIYERIKAHNQMDAYLIKILQSQVDKK